MFNLEQLTEGFLKNLTNCCLSCFNDHLSVHDDVGPTLWHCIKKKEKKKKITDRPTDPPHFWAWEGNTTIFLGLI